jgi:hypothetical protein
MCNHPMMRSYLRLPSLVLASFRGLVQIPFFFLLIPPLLFRHPLHPSSLALGVGLVLEMGRIQFRCVYHVDKENVTWKGLKV